MSASILLIIALIVSFGLEYSYRGFTQQYLELSIDGMRHGYIWQLLTFQFLHDGVAHLASNLLGIWFFGRFIEERLGHAHFWKLYLLSGVAGGLLQTALMFVSPVHFGTSVVGASAGVFGLIAAFAVMEPDATLMAYFFIPLRAKYLLYIELGVALYFIIGPTSHVAHAAHLGGILFAIAYIRWGLDLSRNWSDWNPLQRKMRRERMIKAATIKPSLASLRRRPRPDVPTDLPSDEFISKEVDPILDKISAHGIQSLTDRERAILQAARAKMSKR
jgi:membrane associated rhomboid family serine protease